MEIIILAGIVVLYALKPRREPRSARGPSSRPRGRAVPPKFRPAHKPASKPERRNAPFDTRTAHPAATTSTLSGPAYIIDGDSIIISKTQVRLFGVDAPEINHPFGKKAKWALYDLCKGQSVRAEIVQIDAHGRTVAKCYLSDGRDLSAEMVKQGLAIDWPKFSGGEYSALEVKDARRKMWLADARQKGRMHVWEQFDHDQMRKNGADG